MPKKVYRVVRYEKQRNDDSFGIAAGMWAVVETAERDVAFADSEAQAREIAHAFDTANNN